MAHQCAFARKVGIFFLFVDPLGTATQRQSSKTLKGAGHSLTEIGSNDFQWKAHPAESFAKETRPIDVAVLDEQDRPVPHRALP